MTMVLLSFVLPGFSSTNFEKERPKGRMIKEIAVFPVKDGVEIEIRADGPLPKPRILQLLNPLRLVFDFSKMKNVFPKNSLQVDDPALKGIRIGQHPDRVRIVFDFMESPVSQYQIEGKGDMLKVTFRHLPSKPSAPAAGRPVAKGPSETVFLPKKEGEIQPELEQPPKPAIAQPEAPRPQPVPIAEPDLVPSPSPLAVSGKEVEKTVPSPEPPKPLAVKPPEAPSAPAPGAEIAPPKPPAQAARVESPPVQTPPTEARKISLDFRDADLRLVFHKIAEEANLNIAVSDAVQGKITLRLTDVPWDQALDLILQTRRLAKVQEGNTLTIMTQEEFEKRR